MSSILGFLSWDSLFPRYPSEWTMPPADLRDLTDLWVAGIIAIGTLLLVWAVVRSELGACSMLIVESQPERPRDFSTL